MTFLVLNKQCLFEELSEEMGDFSQKRSSGSDFSHSRGPKVDLSKAHNGAEYRRKNVTVAASQRLSVRHGGRENRKMKKWPGGLLQILIAIHC
jgi:hypothetical protein